MSDRRQAVLALSLLVPAPTLGILCAFYWDPDGAWGTGVWAFSKIWILLFPLLWERFFLKQRLRFPRPRRQGLSFGLFSGLAIAAAIAIAYALIGRQILDPESVRSLAEAKGFDRLGVYLGLCAYLSLVNALLEEYVWRWFVYRNCEALLPRGAAVLAAAACFTLHHVFAVYAWSDWRVTLLASSGVFLGGAVWSLCYLRYRSVWPGYVSHVIADLAIFAIGYELIFRG